MAGSAHHPASRPPSPRRKKARRALATVRLLSLTPLGVIFNRESTRKPRCLTHPLQPPSHFPWKKVSLRGKWQPNQGPPFVNFPSHIGGKAEFQNSTVVLLSSGLSSRKLLLNQTLCSRLACFAATTCIHCVLLARHLFILTAFHLFIFWHVLWSPMHNMRLSLEARNLPGHSKSWPTGNFTHVLLWFVDSDGHCDIPAKTLSNRNFASSYLLTSTQLALWLGVLAPAKLWLPLIGALLVPCKIVLLRAPNLRHARVKNAFGEWSQLPQKRSKILLIAT